MSQIDAARRDLAQTAFLRRLASDTVSVEEKLAFVPAMAFFIMGFRDILGFMAYPRPSTPLQVQVNRHCDEDADHWAWYVGDLERLGHGFSTWGDDLESFFDRLWGDDTRACRDLIYTTHHYVRASEDPVIRLIVIEVMEATFAAFIDALHTVDFDGLCDRELRFFGSAHRNAEASHELGSWVGGRHTDAVLDRLALDEDTRELGSKIVNELFCKFDEMFNQWDLCNPSGS